jgi:hypothetical protein
MAVKVSVLVFWDVTPCGRAGRYERLEEHTASIFRASALNMAVIYLQTQMTLQSRRPTSTKLSCTTCNLFLTSVK